MSRKYASKVDANQKRIVKMLRDLGCSVAYLHEVGSGVPDLLVGYGAKNYLLEVVGDDKFKRFPPDGLSGNQIEWHDA